VSIVAAGPITVGAGYHDIELTAPAAISTRTLGAARTVVLASESARPSALEAAGGASAVLRGAVYAPEAPLRFAGPGAVGGGCVLLDVASIAFAGGGLATNCSGLVSITGARASLVE